MKVDPEALMQTTKRLVSETMSISTTDAALLDRFVRCQDEDAFAAIVSRHGRMVLGVCRRMLAEAPDAEDAFQATFLVLARKAATLRQPESLAAWLHGTAHRLAHRCRRTNARRLCRETKSAQQRPAPSKGDLLDELSGRELLAIIDEELQRLPEAKRLPLILCLLEGRTQEEAAQLLGVTPGSVKSSLERGRAKLLARLARRGLMAPAILVALEVSAGMAGAEMPALLVGTTVKAATSFAAGMLDGTTAQAAALAEEALKALVWAQVKFTVLMVALVLTLAGTALMLRPSLDDEPPSAVKDVLENAGNAADHLPLHALARLGTLRFRHGSVVTCLAVSDDGAMVASGGWDQAVRLWEADTGNPVGLLKGHQAKVQTLAFSPDGKLVASLGENLRVWDRVQCRELWSFDRVGRGTTTVAFSPSGEFLAIPGPANQISLLDAQTGTERHSLTGAVPIQALAFSPDGQSLAAAGADGIIQMWNPTRGKALHNWLAHANAVSALIYTPDGKTLASGGHDGLIRLWDPYRGRQLGELAGLQGLVRSLHCSGNGKFLVSGNGWPAAKPAICLWDIATGKPVRELNGGFLASCFFSSDGRTLFFSRGDAAVRRYDLVEAREIALGLAATKSVVFSPDGEHFAAGGTHLYLCSAASGKILRRLAGHSNGIYSVVFSPDGASLVSAGRDGTIRFWDVQSGKEKQRLEGHKGQRGEPAWINAVAFSPDGKLLADAARDNSVRIWDVAAAKEIHKFTLAPWTGPGGAPSFAYALAFAPNGKTIALAGPGNGITILEQVSDQWSMRSIEGHQSVVEGVAFSPDGATLASTALDGTIRLWDPATGRQVRRFQEPPGWSIRKQLHRDGRSLAFSPDGKSLACGSWQSTCVWELATGQERKLGGHLGEVVSVAFSPDSRKLATCSFDTTVMLWDLNGP